MCCKAQTVRCSSDPRGQGHIVRIFSGTTVDEPLCVHQGFAVVVVDTMTPTVVRYCMV